MTKLEELKEKGNAPEFLTEEAFTTISNGYVLPNETPKEMYERCATSSANVYSDKMELFKKDFFSAMWNNWLCPSTPVLSNALTHNLQISCYSSSSSDSLNSIMDGLKELAVLTKYGGGVSNSYDLLRPSGSHIKGGGRSSGIIPFLRMVEGVVEGTRQGNTRRGAIASYLNFKHGDIEEFIDVRNPIGDSSRKCLSVAFHNAVVIDDESMHNIVNNKNSRDRMLYNKTMNNRIETGEPYILFEGNANKNCPEEYVGQIHQSNLCSEIFAPVTEKETFVCCLSSLNLAKYDEWKDYTFPNTGLTLPELATYFLDAVIENYIKQTENIEGLEKSRRFAIRHRMIGIGVLGWHTLLQSKNLPFDSFQTMTLNAEIFRKMRNETYRASESLAKKYGPCEVVPSRRNSALMAVAPTMSNSLISGGVSQGIEPITANIFVQKSSKGTFIKKNPTLLNYLQENGLDTVEIWEQINKDRGSIKNVKELSPEIKSVFLTAREINQFSIINQSAQRQKFIDQGVSINLFFSLPTNKTEAKAAAKYINDVHIEAWNSGIKSLYYLKTDSPLKGDIIAVDKDGECKSCQG